MKTSETLNIAADLIQVRGWGQGPSTWGDAEAQSRLCLEGGIVAAAGIPMLDMSDLDLGLTPRRTALETCPAYVAVKEYLHWDKPFLYMWNDERGRTAEEVIEVLRAAAAIEEAKEHAAEKVEVSA